MLSFTLPIGPGAQRHPEGSRCHLCGPTSGKSDPEGNDRGVIGAMDSGSWDWPHRWGAKNWGFPPSLDGKKPKSSLKIVWKIFFKITWR